MKNIKKRLTTVDEKLIEKVKNSRLTLPQYFEKLEKEKEEKEELIKKKDEEIEIYKSLNYIDIIKDNLKINTDNKLHIQTKDINTIQKRDRITIVNKDLIKLIKNSGLTVPQYFQKLEKEKQELNKIIQQQNKIIEKQNKEIEILQKFKIYITTITDKLKTIKM